jgi:thiol-disulfide isomerase/thioredoxin
MVLKGSCASVEIPKGGTTHVDLGGTGRPVIGRVELPPGFDMGIDWSRDNPGTGGATTSLKLKQEVPYPGQDMTAEDKVRWREEWLSTEAGRAFQRAERSYDLEIKPDGTFRLEDIPTGTYTLTIAANQAKESRRGTLETLGALQRTVAVPAMPGGRSDEPLDLGALKIKLYQNLQVGDRAPAFDLKTLDDAPLRLADLRGKYVLLDFWATWCGPCREETPNLKALHDTFAKDARFIMIGLSLDEKTRDLRAYRDLNAMPWPQVHLDGESRDSVLAAYGVRTIPSIFLIGPEGAILARDLQGKGIEAAVAEALRGNAGQGSRTGRK